MPSTTDPVVPSPPVAPPAPPRRVRGHVEAFGDDRTCAAPGCRTALSRYNSESSCWTHAQRRRDERGTTTR